MRYNRQKKILELISNFEVTTQMELKNMLKEQGFNATQATISRDIRELSLIKILSSSGNYKYAPNYAKSEPISNRFSKIFKETILSADSSGNIVVVKTLSGCGPAAGEAIDSLKISNIIGSVAGDNTVLLVIDSPENTENVLNQFNDILNGSSQVME